MFRILLATSLLLSPAFVQSPPGSISGIVVKAGAGEVVRKATVLLTRADSNSLSQLTATTGTDGRFSFDMVPPGAYRVAATIGGYVRSEYGQQGPNGSGVAVTVQAGQRVTGLQIALTAT